MTSLPVAAARGTTAPPSRAAAATLPAWPSIPLAAAGARRLHAFSIARKTARTRRRIRSLRFNVLEDDLQGLVTVAASQSGTAHLWLEHFFTAPTSCTDCGAATRLRWASRIADWWIACSRPGCIFHDSRALLAVEVKPGGAPAHWSATTVATYAAAAWTILLPRAGFVLPTVQCTPATCPGISCPAPHTGGRSGGYLAAPQVLRAAFLGSAGAPTPVLLLTDAGRGSATEAYGTGPWGFDLNSSVIRTEVLGDRLAAVCGALNGAHLSDSERAATSHAVAAVWARLPWAPWEDSVQPTSPVESWLPDYATDAANRECASWT